MLIAVARRKPATRLKPCCDGAEFLVIPDKESCLENFDLKVFSVAIDHIQFNHTTPGMMFRCHARKLAIFVNPPPGFPGAVTRRFARLS
ncbi:hypothetical protein [Pelomicrobium methylotrophicum]|uniref:Uncharacterized protein n=1 Tax=Pelomicrobium methylotrophicum TaxID=2602750 RepID=A0A5C7EJV0_9PROT|nr:hypothetical protein [Pelomicrobium methylotrophicum]TXF11620.1 hypothetical protein FR698_09785 [Pelomicrobium methylotrophicum]